MVTSVHSLNTVNATKDPFHARWGAKLCPERSVTYVYRIIHATTTKYKVTEVMHWGLQIIGVTSVCYTFRYIKCMSELRDDRLHTSQER